MASEKQLAANRANARKSTGPRTQAGKERSRMNALKHGLLAKSVLLEHEDPAEWEALCEALFMRFDPADVIEEELVGRVASLLWRMRRIPVFEAALMEAVAHDANQTDFLGPKGCEADGSAFTRRGIGIMFELLLQQDLASKLTRYETGFQNNLKATLDELRNLKRERMACEALDTKLGDVDDAVECDHVIAIDTKGVGKVVEVDPVKLS